MMDLDKKMIGKQFGWLTVIKRADSACLKLRRWKSE